MSGIRTFASMVIALGACATAGDGGGGNNGNVDAPGNTNVDAPGTTNIDAPGGSVDAPPTPVDAPAGNIDAALQTITLSQNGAMTITAANTISCNKGSPGFVTS